MLVQEIQIDSCARSTTRAQEYRCWFRRTHTCHHGWLLPLYIVWWRQLVSRQLEPGVKHVPVPVPDSRWAKFKPKWVTKTAGFIDLASISIDEIVAHSSSVRNINAHICRSRCQLLLLCLPRHQERFWTLYHPKRNSRKFSPLFGTMEQRLLAVFGIKNTHLEWRFVQTRSRIFLLMPSVLWWGSVWLVSSSFASDIVESFVSGYKNWSRRLLLQERYGRIDFAVFGSSVECVVSTADAAITPTR